MILAAIRRDSADPSQLTGSRSRSILPSSVGIVRCLPDPQNLMTTDVCDYRRHSHTLALPRGEPARRSSLEGG